MKVADVMTSELVTCRADDSLNRAAQLMWERRCGTVAIVDDAGTVLGVLTDRDVAMAAYTQGRRLDDIAVASAMSRAVRTCPASASIEDAEDIMAAHAVRRVVIIGDDGRASGMLSIDDIARSGAEWDGKGDIDLEQVALTLGEISRRSAGNDEDTPDEQTPETDINDVVRNSLSALRTLRDEIRVDLNLAGKEVRDRWRRLEARVRAAETHARDARLDAARNLTGVVESAKQFRNRLRDKSTPASAGR
jgi:CBS domain-containing protein